MDLAAINDIVAQDILPDELPSSDDNSILTTNDNMSLTAGSSQQEEHMLLSDPSVADMFYSAFEGVSTFTHSTASSPDLLGDDASSITASIGILHASCICGNGDKIIHTIQCNYNYLKDCGSEGEMRIKIFGEQLDSIKKFKAYGKEFYQLTQEPHCSLNQCDTSIKQLSQLLDDLYDIESKSDIRSCLVNDYTFQDEAEVEEPGEEPQPYCGVNPMYEHSYCLSNKNEEKIDNEQKRIPKSCSQNRINSFPSKYCGRLRSHQPYFFRPGDEIKRDINSIDGESVNKKEKRGVKIVQLSDSEVSHMNMTMSSEQEVVNMIQLLELNDITPADTHDIPSISSSSGMRQKLDEVESKVFVQESVLHDTGTERKGIEVDIQRGSKQQKCSQKGEKRNQRQKKLRYSLREGFEELKRQIPDLCDVNRVTRKKILRAAILLCKKLNRESQQINELYQRQLMLRQRLRYLHAESAVRARL